MVLTPFEMVGEFCSVMGQPCRTTLYKDVFEKEPKLMDLRRKLIEEETSEFGVGCDKKDLVEIADAVCDLLYVVYGVGHAVGLNVPKLFAEVHRSNMTKVCETEEIAQKTVEWYKERISETGYKEPSYRLAQSGKYFVVFDNATGKILKSINYEAPKLNIEEY